MPAKGLIHLLIEHYHALEHLLAPNMPMVEVGQERAKSRESAPLLRARPPGEVERGSP